MLLNAENLAHPVYREVSHSLMWGFHAGLFGMLVVFMLLRLDLHKAPVSRWGPSILVIMGAFCVLFDLTRHVLLDQNIAPMLLHMYNGDGSLTPIGMLGMLLTWVGTALVTVGLMWFLEYDKKVARFFRWIRGSDVGEGKSDV